MGEEERCMCEGVKSCNREKGGWEGEEGNRD